MVEKLRQEHYRQEYELIFLSSMFLSNSASRIARNLIFAYSDFMATDGNDSGFLKSQAFRECAVVFVAVGLLGMVIVAVIAKPRIQSARMTCVNNLRQVTLGMRMWSDSDDAFPMHRSTNDGGSLEWATSKDVYRHFVAAGQDIGSTKVLVCPADSNRRWAMNFASVRNQNLSYWLELNAKETAPNFLMAGDRHLNTNGVLLPNGCNLISTQQALGWGPGLHGKWGNIVFTDHSVQQVNANNLHKIQLKQDPTTPTNWLAVP